MKLPNELPVGRLSKGNADAADVAEAPVAAARALMITAAETVVMVEQADEIQKGRDAAAHSAEEAAEEGAGTGRFVVIVVPICSNR